MKHRHSPIRSTRYARMMRLLRKHEAKRTTASSCATGTLHRAKPCFIFHAPQVRFIEKSTAKAVLFSGLRAQFDNFVLVKFWLRQSDAMLRIVMLLTLFAVMCCVPNHVPKAHFTREAHITSEGYITFRLQNTSLKKA